MQISGDLWRHTPPAIFPPILGLFGLGLAWRGAASVFSVPGIVGEVILGAATLVYLLAVLVYGAGLAWRREALWDDLDSMPGRAGVSSGAMAAMLLAAALAPYLRDIALGVLLVALAAHLVVAALVVTRLWSAPLAERRMTPVWHLTFVGAITAPQAAVALGLTQTAEVILILTAAGAITIWVGNAIGMLRLAVPPGLRPPIVIHLAPIALLGIAAALLGYGALATVLAWLSVVMVAVMLMAIRYLTAAGFSPLWGAFTFPVAAFTGLMLLMAGADGGVFRVLAALALAFISITIPLIATRILKMWITGELARKTAATAA